MNQHDELERHIYQLGVAEGVRRARAKCDVCPERAKDGQPVLISGRDVLIRRGIEN